jgi:hypothetical protein
MAVPVASVKAWLADVVPPWETAWPAVLQVTRGRAAEPTLGPPLGTRVEELPRGMAQQQAQAHWRSARREPKVQAPECATTAARTVELVVPDGSAY